MTLQKSLFYSLIVTLLFALISSNRLYKFTAKLVGKDVKEVEFQGPDWISYLIHLAVFFVLSNVLFYFGGRLLDRFLSKKVEEEKA